MVGIIRWVAPKDALGFAGRFALLILLLTVSNGVFHASFETQSHSDVAYLVAHALFVSGPVVVLFLAMSLFQLNLHRELWKLSRMDGLTGLNNRSTFFDLTTLARAQKRDGVLLMLDADRFKLINDTYGHQVGDACLKSIAYTLQRNVREGDIVGRIGGEEFAIYMHDTNMRQAVAIGERLTKPIPFRAETAAHLTVTLSIGAAVSDPTRSLDTIYARADGALYEAKLSGRAQIVVWDKSMRRMSASLSA